MFYACFVFLHQGLFDHVQLQGPYLPSFCIFVCSFLTVMFIHLFSGDLTSFWLYKWLVQLPCFIVPATQFRKTFGYPCCKIKRNRQLKLVVDLVLHVFLTQVKCTRIWMGARH